MSVLTKDAILEAKDLKDETVEVPEWGGSVIVRCLTGTERDAFESSLFKGNGKNQQENFENLRAKLLVLAIIDEDGKRLFSKKDIDDLGRKSVSVLDRLFHVARKLSGIGQEDVDELTKNLEATQDEDSTSN